MLGDDTSWTRHAVDGGMAIELPAAWFVAHDQLGVQLVAVDPHGDVESFRANLNVAVRDAPDGDRLEDVAARELDAAGEVLTDLEVNAIDPVEIAGHPWVHSVATYRQGRTTVHLEQWGALALDGAAVTMSASAADSEWNQLEPVVSHALASLANNLGQDPEGSDPNAPPA